MENHPNRNQKQNSIMLVLQTCRPNTKSDLYVYRPQSEQILHETVNGCMIPSEQFGINQEVYSDHMRANF